MLGLLAKPTVFKKYLRIENIEQMMIVVIVGFFLIFALLLHFVPVTDFLDGVNGRISSSAPPVKLVSDGQYRIHKVHVRLDQFVRKGDLLLEFATEAASAELQGTETEISGNARELTYHHSEIATITEKIKLNEQIIVEKASLKKIMDLKNALVIQMDGERKVATEKIRTLSSKLLNQILPRIDDPMFSSLDRMKILSNAHAELRQMQDVANQMQNNSYLPEETQRKAAIEASLLRKENADLRLARANAERAVQGIAGSVAQLEIKAAALRADLARARIVAPLEGYVVNVSPSVQHANVVKANEELFAIHDQRSALEAELVLTDEQFKDARVGQHVNMELYAWNHYKHGVVPGEIVAISRSKVLPTIAESKIPTFVATVKIPPASAPNLKMGFDLKAKIILGNISLFEYVLKKLNLTDR